MVEEAISASEASATEVVQTLEPNQASVVQGGTESNNNAGESNVTADVTTDVTNEETLEFAEELTKKGKAFLKDEDFAEAVDCFSRSLEIRVLHYGELAPECINAYYRYGSALLEKAQAEADPLGNMPKKEAEETTESAFIAPTNGESASSVGPSDPERQGSSSGQEGTANDDNLSDADEDDEDDSDLDTAWKMLDIARAITDKQSIDTQEKVDILCALAEISLEREDIESSLSDYKKALTILEGLVEPDSRHIAELNFRICICLEIGVQPKEAISYCSKALSICKSRIERVADEDEIRVLSGLAEDLEKKLEDLKQQAENPKKLLAELMGMPSSAPKVDEKVVVVAASAGGGGEMSSSRLGTVNTGGRDLESPTVSTAHTGAAASSCVTHLGVVGRGVKRTLGTQGSVDSIPSKKVASESSEKADGNSS